MAHVLMVLTVSAVNTRRASVYGCCAANTLEEIDALRSRVVPLASELDLLVVTAETEDASSVLACLQEDVNEMNRET